MREKKTLDMCEGPLLGSVLRFSLPLMATGVLSQLYNSMDSVVVGRCAGGSALAAVGATTTLCWLITETILGLSVGTSVRVANAFGAGRGDEVSDTVHTSILLGLILGVLAAIVGFFGSHTFLAWMNTPEDIIEQSTAYMRIYFLGLPAAAVYMFASAALRATGETRYPLFVLIVSGVVNVALNFVSVAALGMGVRGVAWATVVSQVLSVVMLLAYMRRLPGGVRVRLKALRIDRSELGQLLRIGVPAALQSALFSISNVVIQSGVNSFGSAAVAGNSAASNIESMVYLIVDSLGQAATIFAGQNMGAKKYERLPKVLHACLILSTLLMAAAGVLCCLLREPLVRIFATESDVVRFGAERLFIQLSTYTLVGVMCVASGLIRGMGYSILPTVVSLLGVCALRVAWMYTAFAWKPTFVVLMLCYPFTWLVTSAAHMICYFIVKRRMPVEGCCA